MSFNFVKLARVSLKLQSILCVFKFRTTNDPDKSYLTSIYSSIIIVKLFLY